LYAGSCPLPACNLVEDLNLTVLKFPYNKPRRVFYLFNESFLQRGQGSAEEPCGKWHRLLFWVMPSQEPKIVGICQAMGLVDSAVSDKRWCQCLPGSCTPTSSDPACLTTPPIHPVSPQSCTWVCTKSWLLSSAPCWLCNPWLSWDL
jgi:hypothetical protein